MEFNIILNTEEKRINILYQGYNIIAHTIYTDDCPSKIIELLQDETGESIEQLTTRV